MGDSDFDDDELFKDLYGEEKESKPEIPAKNEQLEKESGAGESEEAATDGKNAEDSREEKQSIPSPQPRSVDATSTGDDSYGARQSAEPTAPVEAPQERQHTEQKPAAQEEQQSPFNREDGKMFIGGLNWETTDESLRDYFEQFGEVLDCTVMRDSTTGRSRGFGFLTFKDPKCVQVVMSKEHHLDGKIIDPKRAIPREEQEKTAKMFVGGVPADCTEEEFRDFFNQFGRVLDATLMMDKDTGRPRGFGFVTFENEAAVENTMSQPYITIHGKPVEVKRATPKASMRDQHDRHQQMPGSYGQGNQYFAQNMNMYGGMTPAMMAQYYRQMQQYMEAVRNMPAAAAAAAAASGGMPYPQGTPGMPSAADWAQQQQQMQAASSHYDPSSGRGGTPNSNTDSYDGGNKPEYGSRGQGGGRSSSNRQRYRGRRGDNRGGSGNGGGAQSFHPYRR